MNNKILCKKVMEVVFGVVKNVRSAITFSINRPLLRSFGKIAIDTPTFLSTSIGVPCPDALIAAALIWIPEKKRDVFPFSAVKEGLAKISFRLAFELAMLSE